MIKPRRLNSCSVTPQNSESEEKTSPEIYSVTEQFFTVSEVIDVKLYVDPTRSPVYDKIKQKIKKVASQTSTSIS